MSPSGATEQSYGLRKLAVTRTQSLPSVDDALSMVVKISERCEAVPACMESMGLLIEVIQMVLSTAVSGAVVDRYIALAVLASMAVEVVVPGSDPPLLSYLIDSGFDPPMQSCC